MIIQMNNKQYGYDDISLVPKKCIVSSRKLCDTSVKLGKFTFDIPVYPANMKTVVDIDTCIFFAKNNWFYTMHRFGVDNVLFIRQMQKEKLFTSISVGINNDSYESLNILLKEKLEPDFITIDVANAWSDQTYKMINFIKSQFNSFLIVGNVATREAILDLQKWRVEACKVGIAVGKICITRNKTGVYRPMVSTLLDCCKDCSIPIIADGGIGEHGDIAKAISCGAQMVMAGSLFAGYDQSAGNIIEIDDRMYKEYYGSASKYNKSEYKNVEGKKILIQYKGNMIKLLTELKEDLQSSISYVGGKKLSDLRDTGIYIVN